MKRNPSLTLVVVFLGCVALFHALPPFQTLDARGLDAFIKPHAPDPDVLILAIDDKSIQNIGRWPWPRATYAKLFDALDALHPRAVGFDVNLSETSDQKNDGALAQALAKISYPAVFPIEMQYDASGKIIGALTPIPEFITPSVSLGVVNVFPDSDGIARRGASAVSFGGQSYVSLGAKVAESLGVSVPAVPYRLNFAGGAGSIPTYSLSDFLAGGIPQEALENKIILIGATASDLHDVVLTPAGLLPGVEWHANTIDNLLLGREILILPDWYSLALALALCAALLFLLPRLKTKIATAVTIAAMAALLGLSYALFEGGNIALPYIYPLLAVLAVFVADSFVKKHRTLFFPAGYKSSAQ